MGKISNLIFEVQKWDRERYEQSAEELGKAIISRIPLLGTAYLYGSGAAKQQGYSKKSRSQLDIIIEPSEGVSVKEFALVLMSKNPHWSSPLSWLSYGLLPRKLLEPSSCITYCFVKGRWVKLYITANIEKYILENGTRDIAGRFSKKMLPLVDNEQNDRNLKAKEQNERNTLASALILLDSKEPTLKDIGVKYNAVSYMGEFRNLFGMEKFDKAEKSYLGEKEYYDSIIKKHPDLVTFDDSDKAKINYSNVVGVLCSGPVRLREKVEDVLDPEETISNQHEDIRGTVANYHIVNNLAGSTYLAVKNVFTTGVAKSVIYLGGKARKAMASNIPIVADMVLKKVRSTIPTK